MGLKRQSGAGLGSDPKTENTMNPTDIGDLTFEMLHQERGCALPPAPPNGEYPLPEGYRSVRKT